MLKSFQTKDGLFNGEFGSLQPLEVKEINAASNGEFEGYASVFGVMDRGADIVAAGAFMGSLSVRPAAKVKMLWQHRPSEVIGKFLEIREDAKGLWVHGKYNLEVRQGAEAYSLMQDGCIDGLSIGYRSIEDTIDRAVGARRLLKVDLFEISVVTFPMLESATVNRVKSGQLPTIREFEEMLTRDAGFSSQQAKTIIASGFKALTTERDAGGGGDDKALQALAELTALMRG